ncbi:hypothetical protein [Novosphingobium sp.]|uniref:hypothetical protein n=1 Tax=Novosphingobium sp. TaxID=1874826 RepID=UPI002736AC62|nr:hypothetical protein [Novosphingobium sp.]MDP3906635.1 hypothetical protein [Novosphingobium sp.]
MAIAPARRGRRIAVLATAAVALLGYGALAAATAFDRAAVNSAAFTRFVPEPFQQRVLARTAAQLREAGQAGAALPAAQKLVARDPMAIDSVGHLATARLARGDGAGALAAFKVSASLGWRDALTQVFWLQAALRGGDYGNAALRFGALARQWPRAPIIDQASGLFERSPQGRDALAQRIANGVPWSVTYATPNAGQTANQLAGRANVLIAAAGRGSSLGCDRIEALTTALTNEYPVIAVQLWRGHCPRAAQTGMVANGKFSDLDKIAAPSPFDWKFPGDGALELEFVNSGDESQALQVRTSSAARVPIAYQAVPLAQGRYRISWTSDAADAATAARLLASLSCRLERQQANLQPGVWAAGKHVVELDFAGACPAPFLQLWLAPGAATMQIDNVAIEPAS